MAVQVGRSHSQGPASEVSRHPSIVALSSSLLTDRILLHSGLLSGLSLRSMAEVWATSVREERHCGIWNTTSAGVEPFPEVRAFREIPHNCLRRLNEFSWDYRQRPPSRVSMQRLIKDKRQSRFIRLLKGPARVVAALHGEVWLENWLEGLLRSYPRSPEAERRLREHRPDVLVTTGPYRYEEPAVAATAMNLGIPVLAFITSWDNVSTKNRMVLRYDGYLVWSQRMKRELLHFYPLSRQVPVYVVGAPQFDVFHQDRFRQTREDFCAEQGLRPDLPVILYALGSPNFLKEHHGALALAERIAHGDLGDVQMIVRPHPLFDKGREAGLLRGLGPRVIVQRTGDAEAELTARSQNGEQIREWVSTFRHADVVVNLSSTVTVDAAICDRPVVNLDFDPEPGQPNQALVKDVNHLWTHFKPVAESGGVWLVNDYDEMVHAIRTYLAHPELHREKRRWIAEYVCGYLDGRCGERMAEAILDFARNHAAGRRTDSQ